MGHGDAAAYALDALDELERRRFERHLATCRACAFESRLLREAATALAFAGAAETAPCALRPSLLRRVRGARIVHARTTRAAAPALAAATAVAAAVAIAAQIWGSALQPKHGTARREAQAAADVVAAPGARTFDAAGVGAKLVVTPNRTAALAVGRLPRP